MKIKIIAVSLAFLAAAATQAGDEAPLPTGTTKHASLLGSAHFAAQDGESLYKSVCAACHMPNAMGGSGAGFYPALAKNDKLAVSSYPVMMVMHGKGGMPAFGEDMTDTQIAAVVGYVRTHFGNSYADPVSLDEVKQVRAAK
ncbi:MAG TPA: cytochrome c [Magnetospirillaceae bacterium]|nr:cytochrome c [Magnetospirillaceae bacterium]